MVCFTLRLPPHLAALLITLLTTIVMRAKPAADASGNHPTLAQQHADAMETALTDGIGTITTELVLHVRGDGCTTDDDTPITETAIGRLIDTAHLRALIHDADSRPIKGTLQVPSSCSPSGSQHRPHPPNTASPPPAKNESSKNATEPVAIVAAESCSNTTTSPPTKPHDEPSSTNYNSAAPPATNAATPGWHRSSDPMRAWS